MTTRRDLERLESARRVEALPPPQDGDDLDDLEAYRMELADALAGVQSTDEPIGSPDGAALWAANGSLLARLRDVDARIAALKPK